MNLSDYELLPGVIVSVKDEEMLGRIKVAVPGGENPSNCQKEAMPWCYPIGMTGTYQGFTKLVDGAKVWVLRNKQDRLEMWYWPMFDLNPNTSDIVAPYDNPDVLISRDLGGQNVYIYYTDSKGIWISIGGAKINITPKGSIEMESSGGATVKLEGENVLLNSAKMEINAVREQPLTDCLKQITNCLDAINIGAQGCWTTNNIYEKLNDPLSTLKGMFGNPPAWRCETVGVE
jgi:hypothetical protein